ncbi:MAG: hypothetical protein V1673_00345 [Candidatus Omnitrophota bacterium]
MESRILRKCCHAMWFLMLVLSPGISLAAETQGVIAAAAEQPTPVKVIKEKKELEVLAKVQLESGKSQESVYIDVSGYEEITLFVEAFPESILTKQAITPMYELKAYFSMTAMTTVYHKSGGEDARLVDQGVQEFGASLAEDNGEGHPNFATLTTGPTTGRALYTPVYGKYLRVTIINRTPGKTMSYRVLAYLR